MEVAEGGVYGLRRELKLEPTAGRDLENLVGWIGLRRGIFSRGIF